MLEPSRLAPAVPKTTRRVIGIKFVVRGFSLGRLGRRSSSHASVAPSATLEKPALSAVDFRVGPQKNTCSPSTTSCGVAAVTATCMPHTGSTAVVVAGEAG